MSNEKFQPPKGTRDFLPEEAILRERVFNSVKNVFERFGFSPAITPSFEYYEVFANKYAIGEESLKNVYAFEDKSKRKLALRFDQTVPMARLVASNSQLPKPFKRYEISRVWRYEEIKRGRWREFWQCDIDIVGSKSMLADAEIIACTILSLKELGFSDVFIRLNNRKLLAGLMDYAGIAGNKIIDALRSIDKLDKIGTIGVKQELKKSNIKQDAIEKIMKVIEIQGKPTEVLSKAEKLIGNNKFGKEGISELREVLEFLNELEYEENIVVDLSLARGLDYYTSTIFEAMSKDKQIGSLAGGGRYDEMVGKFAGSKNPIPAVGIALGIERIIELIKDKEERKKSVTKLFVANVNDNVKKDCLKIVKTLRDAGINTEIDVMNRDLRKQLEYVNSQKIPYTIVVGPNELKSKKYKLRNMTTGKEIELGIDDAIKKLGEIR